MTTLINGLLGGLGAGLVAGVAVHTMADEPSATAVVLSRAVDDATATSRGFALAARVAYGGLAGVGLLALELSVLGVLAVPPSVGEAFGAALGWSALLFVGRVLVWRAVPSLPEDRSPLVELLAYHLVFGLGLGLWIRLTWIT